MQGSITLDLADDSDGWFRGSNGDGCEGTGGYDDLQFGTSVTIIDAYRSVVAKGYLERGRVSNTAGDDATACSWAFAVEIPEGSKFFGVEVSHRGVVTYTRAEATSPSLSLG